MVCDFHSYDLFFLVYLNPVCCSSIDIDFLSLLDRILQILQNHIAQIIVINMRACFRLVIKVRDLFFTVAFFIFTEFGMMKNIRKNLKIKF